MHLQVAIRDRSTQQQHYSGLCEGPAHLCAPPTMCAPSTCAPPAPGACPRGAPWRDLGRTWAGPSTPTGRQGQGACRHLIPTHHCHCSPPGGTPGGAPLARPPVPKALYPIQGGRAPSHYSPAGRAAAARTSWWRATSRTSSGSSPMLQAAINIIKPVGLHSSRTQQDILAADSGKSYKLAEEVYSDVYKSPTSK